MKVRWNLEVSEIKRFNQRLYPSKFLETKKAIKKLPEETERKVAKVTVY